MYNGGNILEDLSRFMLVEIPKKESENECEDKNHIIIQILMNIA